MGQKVNLHGSRVGAIKDWDSRWYVKTDFADCPVKDYNMGKFLKKKLFSTDISKIKIECASDRIKIIICTVKLDMVTGKGGSEIEKLKKEVQKLTDKKLFIDIEEIKRSDRNAQSAIESITGQLENRVSSYRAVKSTTERIMKAGVKGIKTAVAGRPGGADIVRTELYSEGTISLQTSRAGIGYGFAGADAIYGEIGIKVWIYEGEALPTEGNKEGSNK